MLSIESSTFDVLVEKIRVSDPNTKVGLHFLMPDINRPYHCTNLIKEGSEISIHSNTHLYGIITLQNALQQKMNRIIFVPKFNTPQHHVFNSNFGAVTVETNLHTSNFHENYVLDTKALESFEKMKPYILHSLDTLRSLQPIDDAIHKKHSVYWNFDISTDKGMYSVHVPYVCLVCRGDVLVNNLPESNVKNIQHFFTKELMSCSKEIGITPSSFLQMSVNAIQTNNQHPIYIHIANMFSKMIHHHVKYMPDYKATGKKDSIGINIFDNLLYADCEDMAQASYDLMRVFRKIFPSQKSDLLNGSTTFSYHVSAWLNNAYLGIMQGAVRHKNTLGNHIWTVIIPYESIPVFVEGTSGIFQPSMYKYIIRFWKRNENSLHDYLLVNELKSIYGMEANMFLNSTNANDILEKYSIQFPATSVLSELLFVSNLQVETFNIINYIINYK
tara:strand:- start:6365 stop:7696 length:1332 start_codon:yes stop_codon:yes gene_type:complete